MLTAADVQKSWHYLYPDELPALKSLVMQLPPNPVVINLGAGSGTSGLAFIESRPDLVLVTVDIENNDSPLGSLYSERGVMDAAGYGSTRDKRWYQIHGDSKAVGRAWGAVRFEVEYFNATFQMAKPHMVFVDGDHSYEGCKGDIEAWVPHIVDGGIISVHDYGKQNIAPNPDGPHWRPWPGVDSAVNELLIPNFEMILHVDSLIAFKVSHVIS